MSVLSNSHPSIASLALDDVRPGPDPAVVEALSEQYASVSAPLVEVVAAVAAADADLEAMRAESGLSGIVMYLSCEEYAELEAARTLLCERVQVQRPWTLFVSCQGEPRFVVAGGVDDAWELLESHGLAGEHCPVCGDEAVHESMFDSPFGAEILYPEDFPSVTVVDSTGVHERRH